MNIIQMLNVWRWFTKETLLPLLDGEIEYPAWFWADARASGWSFIDVDSQIMKRPIDRVLFVLDGIDDPPVYFILDKTETFISYLMEDYKMEETYRSWLTDEENESLYKEEEEK